MEIYRQFVGPDGFVDERDDLNAGIFQHGTFDTSPFAFDILALGNRQPGYLIQ